MMGKTVLIVEENTILSLYAATLVRKLGHGVAGQARTGEQAIAETHSALPDLVIISMQLPGPLSAVQTIAHLRGAHSTLPVLYVSTDRAALDREQAAGTTYTAFLAKPAAAEEFQSAITHLLATAPVDERREGS